MEKSIPVACCLSDAELRERRETVLHRIGAQVLEMSERENGYAFRFPLSETMLTDLAHLIHLEHQCCPFLRFVMIVEPGSASVVLELTGPAGTKEFLTDFLG